MWWLLHKKHPQIPQARNQKDDLHSAGVRWSAGVLECQCWAVLRSWAVVRNSRRELVTSEELFLQFMTLDSEHL